MKIYVNTREYEHACGFSQLERTDFTSVSFVEAFAVGDPSDSKDRKYSGGTFPEGSLST